MVKPFPFSSHYAYGGAVFSRPPLRRRANKGGGGGGGRITAVKPTLMTARKGEEGRGEGPEGTFCCVVDCYLAVFQSGRKCKKR